MLPVVSGHGMGTRANDEAFLAFSLESSEISGSTSRCRSGGVTTRNLPANQRISLAVSAFPERRDERVVSKMTRQVPVDPLQFSR
jgi:hypothetical protein